MMEKWKKVFFSILFVTVSALAVTATAAAVVVVIVVVTASGIFLFTLHVNVLFFFCLNVEKYIEYYIDKLHYFMSPILVVYV